MLVVEKELDTVSYGVLEGKRMGLMDLITNN